MNLITRSRLNTPTLLSDWLSPSTLLDRDFFDMDPELFPARLGVNMPSANIIEKPKEFLIELAAPGLERKDFNIEIDNHVLSISAEKEEKKEKKEENGYVRKEYSFNSFCRSFTLPENVKEGNIDAKYDNGVLKVTIPKMKETAVKPAHKIPVA